MMAQVRGPLFPTRKTQMKFWAPGFGLVLAVVDVWGMNQQMEEICHFAFQVNQNRYRGIVVVVLILKNEWKQDDHLSGLLPLEGG